MVIYYSLSGKTKTYAEKIADTLGVKSLRLEGVCNSKNAVIAAFAALVTGGKVKTLPIVDSETLYICAPIWAGKPAPFVAYYLKKSDISGKKVRFVFTCADPNPDKYVTALTKEPVQYRGQVFVFCSREKDSIDANVRRVVS